MTNLTQDVPAPEFLLRNAIQVGLQDFIDTPELIASLFESYGQPVIDEVKNYLLVRTEPGKKVVETSINYPKEGMSLPLVAIVMGMDPEDTEHDVLGDFLEFRSNESSTTLRAVVGTANKPVYSILILSQYPNLTVYLYIMVKAIIIANSIEFHKRGMQNIVLGGRDLTLDRDLFPEFAYARQLTVTCLNYFKVPEKVATTCVQSFVGTTTFIDC